MGWDYVSELQTPTGSLFIPQIYEYGESRWNNTDEKTEELWTEPDPVKLCPPHKPGREPGPPRWKVWAMELVTSSDYDLRAAELVLSYSYFKIRVFVYLQLRKYINYILNIR
jgi:hypothetical protein